MDLLNMVLNAGKGDALGKMAGQHNLSKDQAGAVLAGLIPALTSKVEKNVSRGDGLDSFMAALGKGNHERFVDNDDLLADGSAEMEGNKILGHLLGSKDKSRQLAAEVGGSTGVDSGIIKKMLPVAASLLMGAMGKGAKSEGMLEQLGGSLLGGGGGGGGLLGSLMGSMGGGSQKSGASDLVGGLLKGFLK